MMNAPEANIQILRPKQELHSDVTMRWWLIYRVKIVMHVLLKSCFSISTSEIWIRRFASDLFQTESVLYTFEKGIDYAA